MVVHCIMCFQICSRLKDAGLVEEFDAEVNKKVGQKSFFTNIDFSSFWIDYLPSGRISCPSL